MNAQHTPGPWNIFSERDGAREIHPENWLGLPNKSRSGLIARVSPWDGDERFVDEASANAHLIAAAPDMLAALRGMDRILERVERSARGYQEWKYVFEKANAVRAAIAKAEGRA